MLDIFGDITLAQVVIWISIVCAAVWLLRRIWPGLKAATKLTDMLASLPAFMAETRASLAETRASLAAQDAQISEIHHETHTNSGSSIKDATGRIEIGVASLHQKVDSLETRLGVVETTVTDLREADIELTAKHVALRDDFEHTHPRAAIEQARDIPKENP